MNSEDFDLDEQTEIEKALAKIRPKHFNRYSNSVKRNAFNLFMLLQQPILPSEIAFQIFYCFLSLHHSDPVFQLESD